MDSYDSNLYNSTIFFIGECYVCSRDNGDGGYRISFIYTIAGLLGVFSKNNELSCKDVFYKKSDKIAVKIIKIVGYLFMLFYMFDMSIGIVNSNYYSIVWNALAMIVTVFYVIWFSAIKLKSF